MCDLWCTKWHWDGVLSQYFCFPLSVSFHQCSVYMLLLAERQTGEAWEPSKKQCSLRNRGALRREVLLRCFCLRRVSTVDLARSEGSPCYVPCVGAWHQFVQFVCRWFYRWLKAMRKSRDGSEHCVIAGVSSWCGRTERTVCKLSHRPKQFWVIRNADTGVSSSAGWFWSTDVVIRQTLEQEMKIAARKDTLQAAALLVVPQSVWLPCQCLEITKPLEWDLIGVNILDYSV
jgi:hypothetical protein